MIDREFFCRDVLEVAPALVGMSLVRTLPDAGFTDVQTYI